MFNKSEMGTIDQQKKVMSHERLSLILCVHMPCV